MPSKKINIDLNVLNKKNKDKLDSLQNSVNILQDEIKKLKNQIITDINVNNVNFNMLDENTTKKINFDAPFYKNSDSENNLIKPYPINFKTDVPMVADINLGEQAIKYIANAYKELITDLPQKVKEISDKFDFNKNWKEVIGTFKLEKGKSYLYLRYDAKNKPYLLNVAPKVNLYNFYTVFTYGEARNKNKFNNICYAEVDTIADKNFAIYVSSSDYDILTLVSTLGALYTTDSTFKLYEYIGTDPMPVFLGRSF